MEQNHKENLGSLVKNRIGSTDFNHSSVSNSVDCVYRESARGIHEVIVCSGSGANGCI